MRELVDSDKAFSAVYSLYYREHFGYLIGAYVVELSAANKFTLRYQRLLPENREQFEHRLDETDLKLTDLLTEISLQHLVKQFGAEEGGIHQFTQQFSQHPQRQYILEYIDRRLQQALPLLASKPFYQMSKDGYPAWKQIHFANQPAQLKFKLEKIGEDLQFTPDITLNNEKIELSKCNGFLAQYPAWILYNQTVFYFDRPIDGRKIKQFFESNTKIYSPNHQTEAIKRYLLRLIEDYPFEIKGINFEKVEKKPTFILHINRDAQRIFTFRLNVQYGNHLLPLDKDKIALALWQTDKIIVILRDKQTEVEMTTFFQSLSKERLLLLDFSCSENRAYEWLADHYQSIIDKGIEIQQEYDDKLHFGQAYLEPEVFAQADGTLLVKATVLTGDYRLPFAAIRNNILQGEQRFVLPDKSFILLPNEWLSEYRHFFEVAEAVESGFVLQPHQAFLLPAELQSQNPSVQNYLSELESPIAADIPQGINAELRTYQLEGFRWFCFLQKLNLGGILADDMGLGKTLQTLTLLLREKENSATKLAPSLVIMPNSLIFNWQQEIEKFTPNLRAVSYVGSKRSTVLNRLNQYDILLTTYGTVRQDAEILENVHFHYIILDESQTIKNKDSRTTRAILGLKSNHRLSLTGTPIENSTMDLWTQMHFLNPGLLGSASFFERFYANPIERDGNRHRADMLRDKIRTVLLRRTKEMVADELPERQEDTVLCEMASAQYKLYNQERSFYRSSLFQDIEEGVAQKNSVQIFAVLQRLRQIAIHPSLINPEIKDSGKYDIMWEMLVELISAGKKILIFSQFPRMLQIIRFDLNRIRVKSSYIDGSVRDRGKEVKQFQETDDIQVFLISLKAGGVGLNLTAAEYVFLLDPWWNPAVEQQAINRAHRIGQSKKVSVYRFITKNSIEEKIIKLQEQKARIADDIIKTEESFVRSFTREDWLALFD